MRNSRQEALSVPKHHRRRRGARFLIAALASAVLTCTLAAPAYALFSSVTTTTGGDVTAAVLDPLGGISTALNQGVSEVSWDVPEERNDVSPSYSVTRNLGGVSAGVSVTVNDLTSGQQGFVEDLSTSSVQGKTELVSVSNGAYHSCVLTVGGDVLCWGNNSFGQMGTERSVSYTSTPVSITLPTSAGDLRAIGVSSGDRHSCGLYQNSDPAASQDGQVYCWGYRFSGQTHTGSYSLPTRILGDLTDKNVTAVTAGGFNSCAIAEGTVYCWDHQGPGGGWEIVNPIAKTGALIGKTVAKVSAGFMHACAMTTAGEAYCWGEGSDGQLGDGNASDSSIPVLAGGGLAGKSVSDISAGEAHSCAVAAGEAYCWGLGSQGQLGSGVSAPVPSPAIVPLDGRVVEQVTAGVVHSCAVADAAPVCWGARWDYPYQPAGTPPEEMIPHSVPARTEPRTPVPLQTLDPDQISAGYMHTCAISSGEVSCWGLNWWRAYDELNPSMGFPQLPIPHPSQPTVAGPLLTNHCDPGWLQKSADPTRCIPGPTITLSYEVSYSKQGWVAPQTSAILQS